MKAQRLALLQEIDSRANKIALQFAKGELITENIMKTVIDLYSSSQVERELQTPYFETAYHAPVTGELEFLIARILFHYSCNENLDWKILLRRQKGKTAPDIRIEKNNITIAIIEIKAKAGWIQPFLSLERYNHDKKRKDLGESQFEPDDLIRKQRHQLTKYISTFSLKKESIFLFLPTLAMVHRVKYPTTIDEYYTYFSQTSELPKENFILLSSNKRLDLAYKPDFNALEPTDNFEKMLFKIANF